MTNIFEKASRQKLRFQTDKGNLSAEQLWDLPLTSTKGLSLNGIGVGLQHALRDMGDFDLVNTDDTHPKHPERDLAHLRLDIIKHVISVKQAENAARSEALARSAEKQKLLSVLADKQDASLQSLTEEEIKARIAAL